MKIGLAVSTFADDAETCVSLAVNADRAGIEGVFVYDHLIGFTESGAPRASIEAIALLGVLAIETRHTRIGALVLRSGIRPAVLAANSLSTINRISGGRLLVGIGTGDGQSAIEDAMFGIARGDHPNRMRELEAAVQSVRTRGIETWVGGRSASAQEIAARCADGLNLWGVSTETFVETSKRVSGLRSVSPADRTCEEPFSLSWAGLVDMGSRPTEPLAVGHNDVRLSGTPIQVAGDLRAYADAGASWAILAPLPPFGDASVEFIASVSEILQSG